ncbi:unnamed protein product [Cyclocybe aegerita]|uniref:Integrase catalytic domain-containing protein n=1 Tax=Cyclocybe aegerita TaxID=1973307 RepID=A0A8S0X8E8_CYCAE|nr:unnamed protein product [Cyclocybe aegerita]
MHNTPEHNGIVEALNQQLLEKVRAMLHQSGLPRFLWGDAIMHAVWLKNRTSMQALDTMTPYEALTGDKPNLSNLPEWGCKVWVHDADNGKLDGCSKSGRWVGFDQDSTHTHHIYLPEKRTVSIERNVKFSPVWFITMPTNIDMPFEGESDDGKSNLEEESVNQPVDSNANTELTTAESLAPSTHPSTSPPAAPECLKRTIKTSSYVTRLQSGKGMTEETYHNSRAVGSELPKGLQTGDVSAMGEGEEDYELGGVEFAMGAATSDAEGLDPRTLVEAQAQADWPMWEEAIQKELESLQKAGTWKVVERPAGKNIVGCKWVFHIKKDTHSRIEKYKAHLVAHGFTQVYGVDYMETFTPVAKMAMKNDWPIEVFNFNSAFLNGELDKEIYMQFPPGFEGCDGRCFVAKLQKALYGLKQGGHTWYQALLHALLDLGFTHSHYDHGIFFARLNSEIVILAIHVNDCTITGSSQGLLNQFKTCINARYAMMDLGAISWLLRIQVRRDHEQRTITPLQQSYIVSILTRFNFTDLKLLSIPMDPNIQFSKTQCPTDPLEVGTQPNIAFAISTLSQFLDNHGHIHWEAIKHVFRYLSGMKDLGLTFRGGKDGLEGYTDADGASQDHCHAISGYAFLINSEEVAAGVCLQSGLNNHFAGNTTY